MMEAAVAEDFEKRASQRERMVRLVFVGCVVLGIVTGILISSFEPGEIIGSTPIAPWLALAIVAVGTAVVVPTTIWWHRLIDEHEDRAYQWAAYVTAYIFLLAVPLWWILWRGGFVGAPDGVIIYFGFAVIWTMLWLYRRER